MTSIGTLQRRLHSAFQQRRTEGCSGRDAGSVDIGSETIRHGASYFFDGMRRGGNPASPSLLLQFTLDGAGHFRAGRRWSRVGPGAMFTCVIPSAHAYRMPPDCAAWTFFWLIIRHPEFVGRLWQRVPRLNRIWQPEPGSALLAAIEELFCGVASGALEDPWLREGLIFHCILSLERHAHGAAATDTTWEEQMRREAAKDWSRPLSVTALAARFGMSRTAFSHAFRRRTGQSPGAYLLDLRTAEAGRMLKQAQGSVKQAAYATGFCDPAHFAKAFRKKFAVSPSEYRSWFGRKPR